MARALKHDFTNSMEKFSSQARSVLSAVQVVYPIVVLAVYVGVFTGYSIASARSKDAPSTPPRLGPGGKPLPPKKPSKIVFAQSDSVRSLLFQWLSVGICLTYLGNIANVIMHVLKDRHEHYWCGPVTTIYLVGGFMVHSFVLLTVVDRRSSPHIAHWITWIVTTALELILLASSLALYTNLHHEPVVGNPRGGVLLRNMTEWELAEVACDLLRTLIASALSGYYFLLISRSHRDAKSPERQGLLANGSSPGYGCEEGQQPNGVQEQGPAGWEKPKGLPSTSWWEYLRAYRIFMPYTWPGKDQKLQINFILCFGIVFLQRGVQILVPYQAGRITDILAGEDGPVRMPWASIGLYITYRIFQGSNGLLGAVRQVLWIPIEQYSYRELSVAAFEHVHSLSLEFHLGKKTGEVLSALGKGSALNTFLESLTFSVLPMIVDLNVAMVYFLLKFDSYYALVMGAVTFWYVYITIRMASWRADIRRQATNARREEDAVKNDSMMSYETVKYFNAEAYEFQRYRQAVQNYQSAEYHVTLSLALLNTTQNLIFMLGLVVACLIAAYQVTTDRLRVGDFVTLLTYMTQLQGPLNFFGSFYRVIQNNMINSERMLELFKESPAVVDSPNARPIGTCKGDIRFEDVHFSYDARRPALQGLSFRCAPGTTTALVGESGGGKSTVFRLIFRYYNPTSGRMYFDDKDAEDVTIESLRSHIGVVPQDTVLFNESLMYNLKYARQEATDAEVFEACKAASIHEKILSFPDGYQTQVGERGLRLSGGEKQRVAIARTIIKDPRIILLDEATAALDTETEEHIQNALRRLAKGRTMLVIAHRLSTITMCDQILVLHQGRVVERGTHFELLEQNGRYAGMWEKQVRAQKAAHEAKVLQSRADRLRRESLSGKTSAEEGLNNNHK
ncbi:putative vacuolar ABC heavy metal transporter [Piedraia hortae CBS 480.64]|uniref:Putative vacuolar ABC heavy metal transporter n=1 Tax=Piedraia hortae CBS 480.64 TaxID=1314780 RepID=A0A6A7BVB5_9PEZI|nr:putative vacuolar ABC heavy metal transporter [Piedraia hortae CBS 480.64]